MDLIKWTEDLTQVKGNVSQLQATILKIVDKTPNIQQLDELVEIISKADGNQKFLTEKLSSLLESPQIKVGFKFKKLFDDGQLPFVKMMCSVNFKGKVDDSIDYILDYTPNSDVIENIIHDEDSGLPELLPIKDPKLFKKVFIDKLFADPIISLQNITDINSLNNSKLIVKGEFILKSILVDVLNELYPNLYHIDMQFIIERLVNHDILFKISLVYGLVSNLKYKVSMKSSDTVKIQLVGSLFLSYLGGLSLEYSYITLKIWIKGVYTQIFDSFFQLNENITTNVHMLGSLLENEYNFLFNNVEYQTLDTDPYVVKLLINGENVTIGTNSESEESARQNAIKELFKNPKLKSKLLVAHLGEQVEQSETKAKSNDFKTLVTKEKLQVDYEESKVLNVFLVTIRADGFILGSCLNKDKALCRLKCEAMAFDNFQELLTSVSS